MAERRLTIDELEDRHGRIVLLVSFDVPTGQFVSLFLRDLPLAAIVQIVQWLNDRRGAA